MTSRRVLWAVVGVLSMGNGLQRAAQESWATWKEWPSREGAWRAFLEEVRRRVPEGETVYLVDIQKPMHVASWVYPRSVRLVPREELAELRKRRPEAWLIAPAPMGSQERPFLGRVHDFP